jgi:alcohol dehydrogenase (cytochrome c)
MHSHTPPQRRALGIALLVAAAFAGTPAMAKDVTDADILNDAKSTGDVVSFGLGTQGQRFSPSTQINANTVKNLVPAWSMSFGGEKQRGQEVAADHLRRQDVSLPASYSPPVRLRRAKPAKKLWQVRRTACPTASCLAAT